MAEQVAYSSGNDHIGRRGAWSAAIYPAQTFTPAATFDITSVSLRLGRKSAYSGSCSIGFYTTDGNGHPDSFLGSVGFSSSTLTADTLIQTQYQSSTATSITSSNLQTNYTSDSDLVGGTLLVPDSTNYLALALITSYTASTGTAHFSGGLETGNNPQTGLNFFTFSNDGPLATGWKEVAITGLTFTAGVKYAIIFSGSGAGNSSFPYWALDSGGGYGGGTQLISLDGTSTWSDLSGDFLFKINGDTVPESVNSIWIGSAGDFLVAGVENGVGISTDFGDNWTKKDPDGSGTTDWLKGICSSDGTYIIVSSATTIYRSANSGSSWGAITPAGGDTFSVNKMATSDDGQYVVIVGQNSTDPTESCYISADYGVTWTAKKPVASSIEWTDCDISNDGVTIGVSTTSYFYISLDSGATWLTQGLAATAEYWSGFSLSGDGTTGLVVNTNDDDEFFIGIKTALYSEPTWAETTITSAARALLDDTTTAAQQTTLALGTGDAVTHDTLTLSSIAAEGTDVDKFLVDSTGLIKFRTGAEVLSDIGASASSHLHDTDTLQHDAVNSNGGAFSFTTTGLVTFNQSIATANYTAAALLTACATNAGALDFSAASKTLTVAESITVGAVIDDLNSLTPPASDGQFIVATGAGAFAYESTTTARTSLGMGTGDSPTLTGLTLSGLTQGSVVFAGASGILSQDNSNLFWDATNDRLGIGINSGFFPAAGLTVSGEMDLIHTATEPDDHAFELDVDAAGKGDVKAIDIDYITGDITAGEDEAVILINIDEFAATGAADVFGLEVLATEGTAGIYGMKVGVVIGPIHQDSGAFENPTVATNDTPSTDVPVMRDGLVANPTAIFLALNDYILIGDIAVFEEIEFILTTGSSGAGIKPKFEYSRAGSHLFTQFFPVDGTNGFRNTGVIAWDASDLTNHDLNTDTTPDTYCIKITRERNNVSTPPILGFAKTAATTEYIWDKNGDVNIRGLTVAGNSVFGLNSSVFQPTADSTTFLQVLNANGGTPIFNIDTTNDRVGIGTASPGCTLHIKSTTAGVGLRLDRAGTGNDAFLQFATGGTVDWFVGLDNTPVANRPDFQIKTTNNATPEFIIRTSGNVGINVTDPDAKLEIGGTLHVSDAATFDGTLGAGAITGTSLTIPTTGEINFRDTDISIGSTLFDGILDMSADIAIHMFYDNADVGDGVDGQSLNINRRAGAGDDWISLYVDKDRKGLIGFSGDDDLLQLAANALTVNGSLTIATVAAEGSDVDKFLVDSSGVVKYRIGTQVLSDIGASASGHNHSGVYEPADSGLTSLAGLTYASDSMIKVTATDTYAIRTMSEVKTDLSLDNVSNVATDDTAYNATSWNSNTDAATKNVIRDKVETMDTAIGSNTTHRGSDGSDHSIVGSNTTAIGLNTTHRGLASGNPHVVTPTELSLVIGADTQAWDAGLDSLAALGYVSDSMIKITAEDTYVIRTLAEVLSDIGASASGHDHDATYQPLDAELTSLAALSYVAASFVKMTGANTFALRTIGETADDLEGTIDHGNLAGIGDDDHTQYILHSLAGAASDFLVASGANTFVKKTLAETGAILEGDIVHDNLQSIPANDHIDHTGVTLTAGSGIAGGGDISSSISFDLDINSLAAAVIAAGDFVPFWDITATATNKKITFANFEGTLSHDNLADFTGDEHFTQANITTVGTISSGTWQGTTVAINQGGTGQTTAQAAIDALSAVSGATNEHVLTKDTGTGNAKWKAAAGGGVHTILDGSTHSDSVADGVTRGSIIYGNATPKWDELVVGGADTFLGSDGTDVSYRTAAQVMASLSGEAAAPFDFNSQNLTGIATAGIAEDAARALFEVGPHAAGGGDIPSAANSRIQQLISGSGDDTAPDVSFQLMIQDNDVGTIDEGGGVGFQAQYDSDNFHVTTIAGIKGVRETNSNPAGSDIGGALAFFARQHGSNIVEKGRFSSEGYFGINEKNPLRILHVVGPDNQGAQFILYKGGNRVALFGTGTNVAGNEHGILELFGNSGTVDIYFNTMGDMWINSPGEFGIGRAAGFDGKVHIDQSSTTAAIPVLTLDQADLSEEMIRFETTIGVGNPIEALGIKSMTTTHFIKVELPGGLIRYIEAGTIA